MPWRRQTSSVLAPASCSRSTPMICSSLKRLPFIARLLFSGDGLYLISAEFSGCRPKAVRGGFELYLSVPRAASFAVTFRVGGSDQLNLFGLSNAETVIDELLECLDIYNRGD